MEDDERDQRDILRELEERRIYSSSIFDKLRRISDADGNGAEMLKQVDRQLEDLIKEKKVMPNIGDKLREIADSLESTSSDLETGSSDYEMAIEEIETVNKDLKVVIEAIKAGKFEDEEDVLDDILEAMRSINGSLETIPTQIDAIGREIKITEELVKKLSAKI